jgi:hypothetical protein
MELLVIYTVPFFHWLGPCPDRLAYPASYPKPYHIAIPNFASINRDFLLLHYSHKNCMGNTQPVSYLGRNLEIERTQEDPRPTMPESYITRLPVELIKDIFIQYWSLELGNPSIFLSVCKAWRDIATNTKILWTRILYARSWPEDKFISYVKCTTVDKLTVSLAQVDGMNFDFGIGHTQAVEHWVDIFQPFSGKCRSLTLIADNPLNNPVGIFTDVSSLKAIHFHCDVVNDWDSFLSKFDGEKVQLDAFSCNGQFRRSWCQLQLMLDRLQVLSFNITALRNEDATALFSNLNNLREVTVQALSDMYGWLHTEFHNWLGRSPAIKIGSPSLQKITLIDTPITLFTRDSYQNCDELTLIHPPRSRSLSSPSQAFPPFRMPNLRKICIYSGWECIHQIDAPNVEIAELREGPDIGFRPSVAGLLPLTIPHPKILHLHVIKQQEWFITLLGALPFRPRLEVRLEHYGQKPNEMVLEKILTVIQRGYYIRWNGKVIDYHPRDVIPRIRLANNDHAAVQWSNRFGAVDTDDDLYN